MKKAHTNWIITPDKYFRLDEIEKIYDYLLSKFEYDKSRRNFINLFLVEMLLGTGLRASELCNLRINQTPVVLGEDAIWVKGKGGKTRIVRIQHSLAELIVEFVEKIRPGLLPRKIKRKDYSATLLFTEWGSQFTRRTLYDRLRRIGERAKILKIVGPHRFRHTYATAVYQSSHDILALQCQLGHSSINTTAVYAKVDGDRIVEMLNKVGILNVRTSLLNIRNNNPLKHNDLKAG